MYKGLQEIIDASTFSVIPGSYVYAQVKTAPPIDKHFLVSKDADEVTVVTNDQCFHTILLSRLVGNY
jgi:hypothetical protein